MKSNIDYKIQKYKSKLSHYYKLKKLERGGNLNNYEIDKEYRLLSDTGIAPQGSENLNRLNTLANLKIDELGFSEIYPDYHFDIQKIYLSSNLNEADVFSFKITNIEGKKVPEYMIDKSYHLKIKDITKYSISFPTYEVRADRYKFFFEDCILTPKKLSEETYKITISKK